MFCCVGAINKVFKQQHYAFVEFMDRESCNVAIEGEKKRGGYECRIHTPIPGQSICTCSDFFDYT